MHVLWVPGCVQLKSTSFLHWQAADPVSQTGLATQQLTQLWPPRLVRLQQGLDGKAAIFTKQWLGRQIWRPYCRVTASNVWAQAVELGDLGLLRLLRRQYAAALARDPALAALADRLEGACFNVAQPGLGGMLGDMMKALSAGEDDDS